METNAQARADDRGGEAREEASAQDEADADGPEHHRVGVIMVINLAKRLLQLWRRARRAPR